MPFADIEKRRKASRDANRRRRARDRAERAAKLPAAPSPVNDLAAWLGRLTVSQGALAGQPLRLLPWQLDFLAGAFAPDVDTAALSIARGNGKTSLCAAVAAAAVAGPLAVPRGACLVAASSYEQARILFAFALDYLKPWLEAEPDRWRVLDSSTASRVEDRKTGAVLRAIGSDPRRAHGEAPRLILADEPAQWPPNTSERMNAALSTARGKIPDARMIALGTRPAGGAGWFAKLLEGGPHIYAQVHAAPADAALDDAETWEAANPSLPYFPALRTALQREAARALADGSLLPMFRALRLNAGVADTSQSTLIDADTWERVEAVELPTRSGPLVLGVDLGGASAMTAACGYWPETGRLEATAWFPGLPTLAERGLRDGVGGLYVDLHQRGELLTTAGRRTVPVADVLRWALETWGRPAVLVADRFKQAEMQQAVDDAGLSVGVVWRGQGFRDGSEDVRAFRRAVLDGDVTASVSLLIRAALSEATTVADGSGNEKLAKESEGGRRVRARDDVAAAMILAVAEGQRRASRPRRPLRWAVV